jgi:hypothetical protein
MTGMPIEHRLAELGLELPQPMRLPADVEAEMAFDS